MDKYKRFYGLFLFIVALFIAIFASYNLLMPKIGELETAEQNVDKLKAKLDSKKQDKIRVEKKIKKLSETTAKSQKKIFSPIETDLGDDCLFFALYNDVIEMIHANSVKIKKMDYEYNPENDPFVKHGKDSYFVCDINLELVSNYVHLGKLIQNVYQYPYYIKINNVEVKPYKKDKKILLTNMSLRLYAHTEPVEEEAPVKATN